MTGVIELGEDHGALDDRALPSAPWRWRRLDRRGLRTLMIAVLVVFLVGGAVAPSSPALPRLRSVPASGDSQLLVAGDQLFVADAGGRRLSAYALPATGHRSATVPHWWVPLDISVDEVELRDGVLLVQRITGASSGIHLEAFDPRTGSALWRSGDLVADFDVDSQLLLVGSDAGEIQAVDPRTGRARWARHFTADCQAAFASTGPAADLSAGGTPDRLVEACARDSTMRTFDLVTGAELASRHVELGTPATLAPDWQGSVAVTSIGDVVVVAHEATPEPVIDGYDAASLRTLWTGKADPPTGGMYGCGLSLCLDIGNIEEIIDAHTGVLIRMRSEDESHDDALAVVRAPSVAFVADPADVPQTRRDQAGVTVVATPGGRSAQTPTFHGASAGWISVMSFTGVRPGDVTLRAIGPLRGISADGCVTLSGVLACATATGVVTLWRLPPGLG